MASATIIGDYTTEDARRKLEELGKRNGYRIQEWLEPSTHEGEMRVAATRMIKGTRHGLGFRWDGVDLNHLVQRCIALDHAMTNLPAEVARGFSAPWVDH